MVKFTAFKGVPSIVAVLDNFKQSCRSLGWVYTNQDDWIWSGAEYHKFFWKEKIPRGFIHSFKRLVRNDLVYVEFKTGSFSLDKASYTAWIFPSSVPGGFEIIAKNLDFLVKTAIYDLGPAYKGEPQCLKLNQTESVVFDEFERFLNNKYGLEFIEITEPRPSERLHKTLEYKENLVHG